MLNDLRFALRMIATHRWFSLAIVVTLALGIGINSTGIRMALGATTGEIVRLVLSRGMLQLGAGVILGLGGAFAASRLLKSVGFLVQVSPNDPLVFTTITVLLVAIGLFACWLPARRASRVDPTLALRTE